MTRKRYIKTLMAHGYDRNEAAAMAADVVATGWSYQKGYDTIAPSLLLRDRWIEIQVAVEKLSTTMQKVAVGIANGLAAFCEEFRAAMEAE